MKIKKKFLNIYLKIKYYLFYKWNLLFLAEIVLMFIIIHIQQRKEILISFFCILIHESMHILVAKIMGSKFNNFQMHIYGARVELIDVDELNYKEKLLIYISGPTVNAVIFILTIILSYYYKSFFLYDVAIINLGLVLLNIIPAYPLDGARILEIILSRNMLYKKAQTIISNISYLIACIFVSLFIYFIVVYKAINFTMLIVAIIIFYITRTEKKAVMYILMGNLYKKRNKLIKNNYLENRVISVYYKLGLVNLMTIVDKNRFNIFYVLNDDLQVMYTMTEDQLIDGLKKYGNITLEEYLGKRENCSN